MSGRGHRGNRPRGDGSRGPRTSSCSGQPHHNQVSLVCAPAPCTPLPRCLVFSMLWLYSSALHLHVLPPLWSLLPWVIQLASCGAVFVLVTLFLRCICFIFRRLVRLFHHTVFVLIMATELLVRRCMASPAPAPTPTPTPEPLPTAVPAPAPVPRPSSSLEPSVVSSPVLSPACITMGGLVLFAALAAVKAHARWRARRHAGAPCAGPCCTSSFPPPRRRRSPQHPPPSPPPMAPDLADVEMQCDETMPPPSTFEIEQVLVEELPYVSKFSCIHSGGRDKLTATLWCRHAGPQAAIKTASDRSRDQAATQLRETIEREHGGPACLAEVAAAKAAAAAKRRRTDDAPSTSTWSEAKWREEETKEQQRRAIEVGSVQRTTCLRRLRTRFCVGAGKKHTAYSVICVKRAVFNKISSPAAR
jgi:hypothetical protein